jgi:hypothetical protein
VFKQGGGVRVEDEDGVDPCHIRHTQRAFVLLVK